MAPTVFLFAWETMMHTEVIVVVHTVQSTAKFPDRMDGRQQPSEVPTLQGRIPQAGLDMTGQGSLVRQHASRHSPPSFPLCPAPALLLPCPSFLVGQTVSSRAMRQRQRPPSSKDDPRRPSVSCFSHLPLPPLPVLPSKAFACVCGVCVAQHRHSIARDGFV